MYISTLLMPEYLLEESGFDEMASGIHHNVKEILNQDIITKISINLQHKVL
jgi:hypothetical protein